MFFSSVQLHLLSSVQLRYTGWDWNRRWSVTLKEQIEYGLGKRKEIQKRILIFFFIYIRKKYCKVTTQCLIYLYILLFYIYKYLTEYFFYFVQLLLSKISQLSKRCLINVYNGSSKKFWKHRLNLFSSLADYLIHSLLSYIIDFLNCLFNQTWNDFPDLINSVYTIIGEIIPV